MKRRAVYISVGIVAVGFLVVLLFNQGKGFVELDCPGAEMTFVSGVFGMTDLRAEDGLVEVKARAYRARLLHITAKEGNDTWRVYARGPWGELARIKVSRQETTRVKCGPPFTVRADVSRSRDYVSVGYSVAGQAAEHYGRILKNGRQLPAPGVEIVNEKGEKIASGKFAYG